MKTKDLGYSTALFIRDDGYGKQLLLQKKDRGYPQKDKLWTDTWQLIGGRIEAGETPEQAVIRETKEELNLDLRADMLHNKIETSDQRDGNSIPFTLYLIDFKWELNEPRLGEGCGWAFWYTDELDNIKTIPFETKLLKEIIAGL